ncbi:hypothetical protein ACA910_009921 [Epithemia clementina (nom. ined.)]
MATTETTTDPMASTTNDGTMSELPAVAAENDDSVHENNKNTTKSITCSNSQRAAAQAGLLPTAKIHISGHPVLAHKLTILRSSTTKSGTFRAVLREVTYHLGYEASSRLTTRPVAITVPVGNSSSHHHNNHNSKTNTTKGNLTTSSSGHALVEQQHLEWPHGQKLKEKIALIPILRSGLGMVDAMLELFPNAAIHHIGMYKVLGHNPVQYFNRLPRKCSSDVAFVLDPVIQTSSTIMSVISILKKWGVAEINVLSVLASRTGLQQVVEAHPDVYITLGSIDDHIDEASGLIMPGLGDAGDRQFGLSGLFDDDDDEALLHPSKRKRTMD